MNQNYPFIDFYNKIGAHLVTRDFVSQKALQRMREGLFFSIGLPPSFLNGREIIEFGPGSGHYSVFNALQGPKHYTLVDGSAEVLNLAKEKLKEFKYRVEQFEFVESLFKEYS